MPYTALLQPQYSQTEIDARIGARGYLQTFQNLSARHFLSFGKGNNTIPHDYGICWIISKYHLQVISRAPADDTLSAETWVEPEKSPIRLHPCLRITGADGGLRALGQMELCLAAVDGGRIAKLEEIDFPPDVRETPGIEVPKVRKLRIDEGGLAPAHTRTVRYTDLDNNRHMNNLRYVDLVLDALPASLHEEHPVVELELEYVGQCREGEQIEVLQRVSGETAQVLARKQDGTTAVKAVMTLA